MFASVVIVSSFTAAIATALTGDELRILHEVLRRQDYGIALRAGSPRREDVNRALLQIVRSEDWQRVLEQYLGRSQ